LAQALAHSLVDCYIAPVYNPTPTSVSEMMPFALIGAALLQVMSAHRIDMKQIHEMQPEKSTRGTVTRNALVKDDCARVSEDVRMLAAGGAPDEGWVGTYKCIHTTGAVVVIRCDYDDQSNNEPRCWVVEKPNEIQQLWDSIAGGLADVAGGLASLVMPRALSSNGLENAIFDFSDKTGPVAPGFPADGPSQDDIEELKQNWADMSAFEREITVLMLKNAQRGGSSMLQESAANESALTTKGFWRDLFRFIATLFNSGKRSRMSAAQNNYMSMNIGWDHVRSNMRADGWRW